MHSIIDHSYSHTPLMLPLHSTELTTLPATWKCRESLEDAVEWLTNFSTTNTGLPALHAIKWQMPHAVAAKAEKEIDGIIDDVRMLRLKPFTAEEHAALHSILMRYVSAFWVAYQAKEAVHIIAQNTPTIRELNGEEGWAKLVYLGRLKTVYSQAGTLAVGHVTKELGIFLQNSGCSMEFTGKLIKSFLRWIGELSVNNHRHIGLGIPITPQIGPELHSPYRETRELYCKIGPTMMEQEPNRNFAELMLRLHFLDNIADMPSKHDLIAF